jgi:hypothetical protein
MSYQTQKDAEFKKYWEELMGTRPFCEGNREDNLIRRTFDYAFRIGWERCTQYDITWDAD